MGHGMVLVHWDREHQYRLGLVPCKAHRMARATSFSWKVAGPGLPRLKQMCVHCRRWGPTFPRVF